MKKLISVAFLFLLWSNPAYSDEKIIDGEYFKSKRDNTILVGKKLADRLNLKLKSKVVITFQDEYAIVNGFNNNDCVVEQYRNYFYDGMSVK